MTDTASVDESKITTVGSFYKDYELIRKRKKVREEVQRMRARLDAKVKEQERLQHEQQEKQRKEQELQKLRQLEAWKREQEWKTKHYFEHNQYHRKMGIPGDPTYSGDIEIQSSAWRPHGKGKFIMNNVTIIDGVYNHGEISEGRVLWKNFYQWEGMLYRNKIHGMGVVTRLRKKDVYPSHHSDSEDSTAKRKAKYNFNRRYQQSLHSDRSENSSVASKSRRKQRQQHSDDEDESDEEEEEGVDPKEYQPREAIANDGEIVCYRDQLMEGLQIEFQESLFNNYMNIDGHMPRVTLLKFIKGWKYLCRFHEETWPRERVIDFCRYNRFRILSHLPHILDIHAINITPDAQRMQDYREQSYINQNLLQSSSHQKETLDLITDKMREKEERKVIYRNLVPITAGRPADFKRRNIFESRAVGIGQAREEDDDEEKERLKALQWAQVLAERKAKFMDQKQKMYEDEQRKQLESSAAAKRQVSSDIRHCVMWNYFCFCDRLKRKRRRWQRN